MQLDKSLPAPLGTIGAWLYRAEVALREEITIQQVHEETANTIQRKREQHKVNTLAGKPSSVTVLVLPNQVCLPITQRAKGWDTKICSRERVYSQGSQLRRERTNFSPSPWRWGVLSIYGIKLNMGKVTGDKKRVRWSSFCAGVTKPQTSSWAPCSENVASVWSEGGVLGPLTSMQESAYIW